MVKILKVKHYIFCKIPFCKQIHVKCVRTNVFLPFIYIFVKNFYFLLCVYGNKIIEDSSSIEEGFFLH